MSVDAVDFVEFGAIVDAEAVIEQAFVQLNIPRLGGASGRGWSRWATLQRCPYLHYQKYFAPAEQRLSVGAGFARTVGSLMHVFHALHYWPDQDMVTKDGQVIPPVTPEDYRDVVLALGGIADACAEAWRLYEAYRFRWENDYLVPLAVELHAADPVTRDTCRYDLVARVDEPQETITPGNWIVELKTASRFDESTLEGWRNDGEVMGELMLWEPAGLVDKYGPLEGVIINLVGKQKIPQFMRIPIPIATWRTQSHRRDLDMWKSIEELFRTTNRWPRSRSNCTTKYGLCEMFDWCGTGSDEK